MAIKVKNAYLKLSCAALGVALALSFHSAKAMDEVPGAVNYLPKEILMVSFQSLLIKDLGRCAPVSKLWDFLSSDDAVWEVRARLYAESGGEFHEKYINRSLLNICIISDSWKEVLKKSYPYWHMKDEKEKESIEIKKNFPMSGRDFLFYDHFNSWSQGSNSFQNIKKSKREYKSRKTSIFNPAFKKFIENSREIHDLKSSIKIENNEEKRRENLKRKKIDLSKSIA